MMAAFHLEEVLLLYVLAHIHCHRDAEWNCAIQPSCYVSGGFSEAVMLVRTADETCATLLSRSLR